MGIIGFVHSGITVKDLQKSIDFYVNKLGFKLKYQQIHRKDYVQDIVEIVGVEEIDTAIIELSDGAIIELLEYRGVQRFSGSSRSCDYGTGHICLLVEEIEQLVDHLKKQGVHFQSKSIVPVPSGIHKGAKSIYMLDPDGYIIEIMER